MNALNELESYLLKLDIESGATSVYLELVKNGPTSALQLARLTRISRTQTYRHLENLQNCGIVSAEPLSYGTLYRALPLENIEALIAERESKSNALRQDLSSMVQLIQSVSGSMGPKATTNHHYGLAGLKQVNWNLTKAQGEFRVFEAAHLSQHLDKAFARRCRERYLEKKLVSYDLTNDTAAHTSELEPFEPSRTHIRHIDPKILAINFEVYIYNDVVTLLDYSQDNEVALEIHHPTLNTMMRQLFDAVWLSGTPITID